MKSKLLLALNSCVFWPETLCLYSSVHFCSTLCNQNNVSGQVGKPTEVDQERGNFSSTDVQQLEELLQVEREQRGKLEREKEELRQEKEKLQEQREQDRGKI